MMLLMIQNLHDFMLQNLGSSSTRVYVKSLQELDHEPQHRLHPVRDVHAQGGV